MGHARRRLGRTATAFALVVDSPHLDGARRPCGRPVAVEWSTDGFPGLATPAPTPVTRTFDLSRDGAAVTQYTSYWCVPASVQTMLNLVTGRSDRSYATQSRLYTELRQREPLSLQHSAATTSGAGPATDRPPAGRQGLRGCQLRFAGRSLPRDRQCDGRTATGRDRRRRGQHAWTVVGFRVARRRVARSRTTVLGFYVVGPLGRDPTHGRRNTSL